MKINGINVKTEFDSEANLELWVKSFIDSWPAKKSQQNLQIARDIAKPIIEAYKKADEYEGPISKLQEDIDGNVILPEGTIFHATPPFLDKQKTIIDYDKLSSIGKTGLISLGMLGEDACGWDSEVPLQVSFHRCNKSQTVEEKMKEICRSHETDELYDIFFIIDVQNDGIKKLLSFDI